MNQYQIENDIFFKEYLEKKFFRSKIEATQKIELIIRPECNQKCDYCYITQHGSELYPLSERRTKEELLKNVDMILEYLLVQKKVTAWIWDIFAGDLFYDDIWFDIIDLFYKYYSSDFYQNGFLKHHIAQILLPTNLSFVADDEKIHRFEEQKEKMDKINVKIHLSYSTDGFYAVDSREKKTLSQEWFDKTLSFCAKHEFGVHPMVSYENIDNYINNYNWWIENISKHYNNPDFMWSPMFLQVRNDGWTNESIQKYLELLDYMINFRLELFDGNVEQLAEHFAQGEHRDTYLLKTPHADLIRLKATSRESNTINCSMPNSLTINCANLRINPCHRLTYHIFSAGEFIVENDKIIDIKSLPGLSGYLNIVDHNRFLRPDCIQCRVKDFCMQGCMGAQFECWGDVFKTVPSVCTFLKAHYEFLINKYQELGILDIFLNPNFKYYKTDFVRAINNYYMIKEQQERKGQI